MTDEYLIQVKAAIATLSQLYGVEHEEGYVNAFPYLWDDQALDVQAAAAWTTLINFAYKLPD